MSLYDASDRLRNSMMHKDDVTEHLWVGHMTAKVWNVHINGHTASTKKV